jgi:hypothetical protein
VLARGFLVGVALTGLVLLKPARFGLRALRSRRAMLLRLQWSFRRFVRLNIGTRNFFTHIVLRGNILRLVESGWVALEWLLFLARLVDIGTWRPGGLSLRRSFGWSSTPPPSVSSTPASRWPPAAATC